MRVLAFDPGFERLGVAVLEKTKGGEKLLHSDCVRTSKALPFPERLRRIGEGVEVLIKKYKPDAVALEEVFFEKNAKTAMRVAEVRGALIYLAASRGVPLFQYTPQEVKVATTGYGKSDKRAVGRMVTQLVRMSAKKRLDDEMDAVAVGITCLASVRGFGTTRV